MTIFRPFFELQTPDFAWKITDNIRLDTANCSSFGEYHI